MNFCLRAYKALEDAKRAHELLEQVNDDEQLFRIYWFSCIGLLRSVSEVLQNEAKINSTLKQIWGKRFNELQDLAKKYKRDELDEYTEDFLIWTCFLKFERDKATHHHTFGYAKQNFLIGPPIEVYDQEWLDTNIYRPMGDIDTYGDKDCRDWIFDAIRWWKRELDNLCLACEKSEQER